MHWLTEEIIAECRSAEVWWAERLPAIKARADATAARWREEAEQKARWACCDW